MKTVQIKTAELTGLPLNWAVAKARDIAISYTGKRLAAFDEAGRPYEYSPSTDWSQGGPLLTMYHVEFEKDFDTFEATAWKGAIGCMGFGRDHLTAACRAIIELEIDSDTVEVPADLVGEGV